MNISVTAKYKVTCTDENMLIELEKPNYDSDVYLDNLKFYPGSVLWNYPWNDWNQLQLFPNFLYYSWLQVLVVIQHQLNIRVSNSIYRWLIFTSVESHASLIKRLWVEICGVDNICNLYNRVIQ